MFCTSFVQPCSPQHFSLPLLCVSAALAVVSNIFIRERLFPHIGSKQDPSLLTLVRAHSVCSYALVTPQFHDVIPTLLCVSAALAVVNNIFIRERLSAHIGSKQDPSLLTLVRAHPVCSYALVTPQFHDVFAAVFVLCILVITCVKIPMMSF